jgi:outer membrane protein OmpA-like peptidoglycan-associated protein
VRHHATAADRLATGGWGEDRPKDDNRTVEGRALNRRVELRRL